MYPVPIVDSSAGHIKEPLIGSPFADTEGDGLAALWAPGEVFLAIDTPVDPLIRPGAHKLHAQPGALIRLVIDDFEWCLRWRCTKGHWVLSYRPNGSIDSNDLNPAIVKTNDRLWSQLGYPAEIRFGRICFTPFGMYK